MRGGASQGHTAGQGRLCLQLMWPLSHPSTSSTCRARLMPHFKVGTQPGGRGASLGSCGGSQGWDCPSGCPRDTPSLGLPARLALLQPHGGVWAPAGSWARAASGFLVSGAGPSQNGSAGKGWTHPPTWGGRAQPHSTLPSPLRARAALAAPGGWTLVYRALGQAPVTRASSVADRGLRVLPTPDGCIDAERGGRGTLPRCPLLETRARSNPNALCTYDTAQQDHTCTQLHMTHVRAHVLTSHACTCPEGADGLWWEVRRHVETSVEPVGLWDVPSRAGARPGRPGRRRRPQAPVRPPCSCFCPSHSQKRSFFTGLPRNFPRARARTSCGRGSQAWLPRPPAVSLSQAAGPPALTVRV